MLGGTNPERVSYWLFKDRIPLTKLLIAVNVLTFFMIAFGARFVVDLLAFSSVSVLAKPWTMVTYPLAAACCNPINLLFQGYWLWVVGGSLERSWSTRTFAVFLIIVTVITALAFVVGGFITGRFVMLSGLWLPLAALTMAFAMMNPEQQILFFFIIPLKLKYLAIITVALVFLGYGRQNPVLGILALSGCAYAYWYVRAGSRLDFNPTRREDRVQVIHVHRKPGVFSRLNPSNWLKEYRERKRLRDFFDRSGFRDD